MKIVGRSLSRLVPFAFILASYTFASNALAGFDLTCKEVRRTGHSFDFFKKKLIMDKVVKKKGADLLFQSGKGRFTAIIDDATLARHGKLVQLNHKTVWQYVDYNGFGEIALWRYYPGTKLKDGSSLMYHYEPSGHLTTAKMKITIYACKDIPPQPSQPPEPNAR